MTAENTLWNGSPSQWLNLWHHLVALLAAAAVITAACFFAPASALLAIPLGYAAWRFLVVRCQRYELTSERIRVTTGVLNQHIDEIELYRVKDIQMSRALWMRLLGLSSLHLQTSDRSLPVLVIPAVHDGVELREKLRTQVEQLRDSKRVREMDFDEHGDGIADGDEAAPTA